jgi:hypothetical protein
MIDTIDMKVVRTVSETLVENLPPGDDVVVHTLTITLNGAHGGVDVRAELFQRNQADKHYSWRAG